MKELGHILDELANRSDIAALLISSGKPGIFIAGADIDELAAIASEEEAEAKSRAGQAIFAKLSALPFPSFAVIDGACVGGGLECALACDYRLVTNSEKTKLGLPEVNLGIIPGWGGTQRLPRLVGLPNALDLILSGRSVDGRKALKIGLADQIIAPAFLSESVDAFVCAKLQSNRVCKPAAKRNWLLCGNPLGRTLVFRKARQRLLRRTKGHYPAPEAALRVMRRTFGHALEPGLILEAKAFSSLCVSRISKNLTQLFHTGEALKKSAGIGVANRPPDPVQRAVVMGAGVMGGGIAWLLSANGIGVRLKDVRWEAIGAAFAAANDCNAQQIKRGRLSASAANLNLRRIAGTVDFTGLRNADIVIEAVVEDLAIKRKALADVESQLRRDAVIATNTSSLSIADLASALHHPERFVGMHFFNPVNRMPLVEVISGPQTGREALTVTIELARRLGKTPIVVNNCAGFLVNRILIPYLNESAFMLEEGTPLTRIDRAIEQFGLPMGPFALADEVGIDVGLKVASVLENAYGERMKVAAAMRAVYEEGKLVGKKKGRGFYLHNGSERRVNDAEIAPIIGRLRSESAQGRSLLDDEGIVERAMLIMINEAARCLDESIVSKPEYLDMAMILGAGFPPFRGGPLRYADELGLSAICRRLDQLSQSHGVRFEPAPLLVAMERSKRRFYQD